MNRNSNGAGLIGNGACNSLTNPPGCIGGKLIAATVFKLIDRLHEANVAFLNKIKELQAAIGVFLGDGDDQSKIGLGHLALGLAGSLFASNHLGINIAQIRKRQNDLGLNVYELLLELVKSGKVTLENIGGCSRNCHTLLGKKLKVGLVAAKVLQKPIGAQPNTVDCNIPNRTLGLTNFINLSPKSVGKLLDHFGCKANAHKLVNDGLLRLVIRR